MYHVHHVNKYVNYAGSWTTFFMAFFCASFARVLVPSPAGGAEILLVHRYPPPRFHFTAGFCLRVGAQHRRILHGYITAINSSLSCLLEQFCPMMKLVV